MATINTETVKQARSEYKLLERRLHSGGLPLATSDGRNKTVFHKDGVVELMGKELMRNDGGGSLITRSALQMVDQALTAAEILEKSTEVVENQLAKFHRVADSALEETKKRVSQLNDYNNRLTTSLANLNKTLGDEKMVRALENADRISQALSLLDALEKKGSLQKIMNALK